MSSNRWNNPVNSNILRDLQDNVLASGSIAIYAAGTSTPLAVYSDKDQTISLGSTLNCDAYGLIPDFHVPENTQFKVVAYDAQDGAGGSGAVQWTRDYIYTSDKSIAGRVDSLEATVNALTGLTRNACVNGGMRVATNSVLTLTSTMTEGKVNRLFGKVTNVTAGTLTQGTSTAYASGYYARFAGVSMSASGVVEGQIRIPAGEAARFVDQAAIFSCLFKHDVGSSISVTLKVKTPTTTADDFSALTTIGTDAAQTVVTGTDTRMEFAVTDMGDCSKGIALEFSAAIASSITTKNFDISEAQFEIGGTRTSFAEQEYEFVEDYFAPTKAPGDNTTAKATTAFVQQEAKLIGSPSYAEYDTYARITTTGYLDDTTPLSTEGDLIMTNTRSAASVLNKYKHTVTICGQAWPTSAVIVSVFSGSTLIHSQVTHCPNASGDLGARTFSFHTVPGSTSSIGYTVRVGVANPGYFDINGYSGARILNGTQKCTYEILELAP